MAEDPRRYLRLMGIRVAGEDPTLEEYGNFFHLLQIEETKTNSEVLAVAMQKCRDRSAQSDGFSHHARAESGTVQKRITQGALELSDPAKLKNHRNDLRGKRLAKLVVEAQRKHQCGTSSGAASKELVLKAADFGFSPPDIDGAVAEAMKQAGPWPEGEESPWRRHCLNAAVICLTVFVAGLFSMVAGILVVIIILSTSGWAICRNRSWQRRCLGAFDKDAAPPVWRSAACLLGLAASLGTSGRLRHPAEHPAEDLPPPQENHATQATPTGLAEPKRVALRGLRVPTTIPLDMFLAPPSAVSASSVRKQTATESFAPDRAVDGRSSSYWMAEAADREAWFEVELEQPLRIDGILLMNGCSKQAAGVPVRKTRLEFDSGDPVEIELSGAVEWQFHALAPRATRKVRLVVLSLHGPQGSHGVPCLAEIWYAHQAGMDSSGANWNGEWRGESLGPLKLDQQGDWVIGSYDDGAGSILARSSGHTLIGTWLRGTASGGVMLQISRGGHSFSGKWKSTTEGDWLQDDLWSGKRKVP